MATTLRDFDTGKKVTCENTGKKFAGKAVYRNVKTGDYYERMSPNGRKCGLPYFFRNWRDNEWVEANWK